MARREGEETRVGWEKEAEESGGVRGGVCGGTMVRTLDAFGRERESGAAEGTTEEGRAEEERGVVGAGRAEKTGVVTLEDAVEEGAEETGCSGSGSTVRVLTG